MTEAVAVGCREDVVTNAAWEGWKSWRRACVEVEAIVEVVAAAPAWGGGELVGVECDGEDPWQSQCHRIISATGKAVVLAPDVGQAREPVVCPVLSEEGSISYVITCLFSKVPTTVDKRIKRLHGPFSQSVVFYRITIDWDDFLTRVPPLTIQSLWRQHHDHRPFCQFHTSVPALPRPGF